MNLLQSAIKKLDEDCKKRRTDHMKSFFEKYETNAGNDSDDEVIDLRTLKVVKKKGKSKKKLDKSFKKKKSVHNKGNKFGELDTYSISRESKKCANDIKRYLKKHKNDSTINQEIEAENFITSKDNLSLCEESNDETLPLNSAYNPFFPQLGRYYHANAKLDCLTCDDGQKDKRFKFGTVQRKRKNPVSKLEALLKDLSNCSLTDKVATPEISLKSSSTNFVDSSFKKPPVKIIIDHVNENNISEATKDNIPKILKPSIVKNISTKKKSTSKNFNHDSETLSNKLAETLLTENTHGDGDDNVTDATKLNKSLFGLSNPSDAISQNYSTPISEDAFTISCNGDNLQETSGNILARMNNTLPDKDIATSQPEDFMQNSNHILCRTGSTEILSKSSESEFLNDSLTPKPSDTNISSVKLQKCYVGLKRITLLENTSASCSSSPGLGCDVSLHQNIAKGKRFAFNEISTPTNSNNTGVEKPSHIKSNNKKALMEKKTPAAVVKRLRPKYASSRRSTLKIYSKTSDTFLTEESFRRKNHVEETNDNTSLTLFKRLSISTSTKSGCSNDELYVSKSRDATPMVCNGENIPQETSNNILLKKIHIPSKTNVSLLEKSKADNFNDYVSPCIGTSKILTTEQSINCRPPKVNSSFVTLNSDTSDGGSSSCVSIKDNCGNELHTFISKDTTSNNKDKLQNISNSSWSDVSKNLSNNLFCTPNSVRKHPPRNILDSSPSKILDYLNKIADEVEDSDKVSTETSSNEDDAITNPDTPLSVSSPKIIQFTCDETSRVRNAPAMLFHKGKKSRGTSNSIVLKKNKIPPKRSDFLLKISNAKNFNRNYVNPCSRTFKSISNKKLISNLPMTNNSIITSDSGQPMDQYSSSVTEANNNSGNAPPTHTSGDATNNDKGKLQNISNSTSTELSKTFPSNNICTPTIAKKCLPRKIINFNPAIIYDSRCQTSDNEVSEELSVKNPANEVDIPNLDGSPLAKHLSIAHRGRTPNSEGQQLVLNTNVPSQNSATEDNNHCYTELGNEISEKDSTKKSSSINDCPKMSTPVAALHSIRSTKSGDSLTDKYVDFQCTSSPPRENAPSFSTETPTKRGRERSRRIQPKISPRERGDQKSSRERRRGRPRKIQSETSPRERRDQESSRKRGRGRPRKIQSQTSSRERRDQEPSRETAASAGERGNQGLFKEIRFEPYGLRVTRSINKINCSKDISKKISSNYLPDVCENSQNKNMYMPRSLKKHHRHKKMSASCSSPASELSDSLAKKVISPPKIAKKLRGRKRSSPKIGSPDGISGNSCNMDILTTPLVRKHHVSRKVFAHNTSLASVEVSNKQSTACISSFKTFFKCTNLWNQKLSLKNSQNCSTSTDPVLRNKPIGSVCYDQKELLNASYVPPQGFCTPLYKRLKFAPNVPIDCLSI